MTTTTTSTQHIANGLSTFGTLYQKMSILVHCRDLSAVFYV